MPTSSLRAALVSGCFALFPPLGAMGLTIDDFSGTTQSVTDCTAFDGVVSSEEAHAVLGGTRYEQANSATDSGCTTTSAGGGTGSISTDSGGSGQGTFHYDGNLDGFQAGVSGSLNVDLTQGGTLDRLTIEILSVTNFAGSLNITVWDAATGDSESVFVNSAGDYEILFSAYAGVDFTDIQAVRILTPFLSNDASIVFGSFSAVPEPSTALLLVVGLAGLAVRARGLH